MPTKDPERLREQRHRYNVSEKGRARTRRHVGTEKEIASRRRYEASAGKGRWNKYKRRKAQERDDATMREILTKYPELEEIVGKEV